MAQNLVLVGESPPTPTSNAPQEKPLDGTNTNMVRGSFAWLALALCIGRAAAASSSSYITKSGMKPWVDVYTPQNEYTIVSSRGREWELVFSDEFNVPGRDFSAGGDYLWTALEMPDGVNAALEYYSINMTSTKNESDGRGVFQIEIREEPNITFSVFNAYTRPPEFQDHSMYYRAGMVQSWNKFCFQGGYIEVSAQLPGAISSASGNPDLGDSKRRVETIAYYPTWPGIWLMGNLGRALFTGSTNRMWPWSYNECNEELSKNQRISACDGNPGYGLNKHQGRGAPEIDILEGGGTDVSTSIQIAPGMPDKFRQVAPVAPDGAYCIYGGHCKTMGANFPGIPNATYAQRSYPSWYQGLRYAANPACTPVAVQIQSATTVLANYQKGWSDNACSTVNACPGSKDGYSDLGRIDNTTRRWGINDIGGCMPVINGYQGSYLCDPDNKSPKCADPLRDGNAKSNTMPSFNYQMDALSANSGLPLAAYTGYLRYQLEWVTGRQGYVRWMVEGVPIYEIPAETMENPPQDDAMSNPRKLMIEEPMYLIFNVALSTSWGAKPPNPGQPCRGDGSKPDVNKICDDFPLYMKIDYIRLYQDTSAGSNMSIGCDPASHPTKEWIEGHLEQYEDSKNKWIEVKGGAPCFSDSDCTVSTVAVASIITGKCSKNSTCTCLQNSWGGPRCTIPLKDGGSGSTKGFGPSTLVAGIVGGVAFVVLLFVVYKFIQKRNLRRLEQAYPYPKGAPAESLAMEDVAASQSQSADGKVV